MNWEIPTHFLFFSFSLFLYSLFLSSQLFCLLYSTYKNGWMEKQQDGLKCLMLPSSRVINDSTFFDFHSMMLSRDPFDKLPWLPSMYVPILSLSLSFFLFIFSSLSFLPFHKDLKPFLLLNLTYFLLSSFSWWNFHLLTFSSRELLVIDVVLEQFFSPNLGSIQIHYIQESMTESDIILWQTFVGIAFVSTVSIYLSILCFVLLSILILLHSSFVPTPFKWYILFSSSTLDCVGLSSSKKSASFRCLPFLPILSLFIQPIPTFSFCLETKRTKFQEHLREVLPFETSLPVDNNGTLHLTPLSLPSHFLSPSFFLFSWLLY